MPVTQPTSAGNRSLAVSIVTYRTPQAELTRCLDSLATDAVGRIEIIDNAGESRIRQIAGRYPKAVYSSLPNPGYGAAHNTAMRRSITGGFEYHLVVNPDVYFDPAVLPRLVEYLDAHPRVGQLQPRIEYPDHSLQYTVRLLPAPTDLIIRRFLPRFLFKKRNARYTLQHIDHTRTFNVPYHQGSFMLLRTEALRDAGLFDERFFMYPEDIDLTRRIHRRWLTLYYPHETIVHDHRAASYHNLRMLWVHIANICRYFNKWGWLRDSERQRFNAPLLP